MRGIGFLYVVEIDRIVALGRGRYDLSKKDVSCRLRKNDFAESSGRKRSKEKHTGGRVFLNSPQLIFANRLTSLAPLRLPRRLLSSFSSSWLTQSLQALDAQK